MTSLKARRTRLGSLLAVALGAAAIFVLPGLASARDDSGPSGATIESFDPASRTLAVALPNSETVTGTVTRRTKIRCEDQSSHRGRHGRDERVRGREAEPGDDHGGDSSGSAPGQSGSGGHDDNGRGANCGTANLVPGAAVDEIELDFGQTSVRFDEVELD